MGDGLLLLEAQLRDALAQRAQRLLGGHPPFLEGAQLVGEVLEAGARVGERALGVGLHGECGLQPLADRALLQRAQLGG